MHRLLPFFFFFSCLVSFGQNTLFSTAVAWVNKADKITIDSYLKGYSYQFIGEKDSLNLHLLDYSLVKTENGTQPFIHVLLSDTALEYISIDTYGSNGQQGIVSGMKNGRFKSIGTDINGNFITTTYDNGNLLVQEDYEAIPNPLGKGEIAYFRYRIFRKYGRFDEMNGEKVSVSKDGSKISENYKNGLLDGQRIIYFPNGTIKRTENYRAGRLNGLVSDYNETGKLTHTSTHSYHWKYGMEKWYNNEGKTVRSLQWQRDLPVGTEKQTFNGKIVGSIPYVKGVKQGLAKVPFYDEGTIDSIHAEPLGIETVQYLENQKHGKAICMRFGSNDTLYTAFYKAGKLDSTYTWYQQSMYSYYKNVPRFTTTFADGLEHGKRIYRITSGPLKDSVYRIEPYNRGKLDGEVLHYYRKTADKLPEFVPGEWVPGFSFQNYRMGVLNGLFLICEDSVNFNSGAYVNGVLEGPNVTATICDGKHVKISGTYEHGLKNGEWTTENTTDKILLTEHFYRNQKDGSFTKKINGFVTEDFTYEKDTLKQVSFLKKDIGYNRYSLDFMKNPNLVILRHHTYTPDSTSDFSYLINTSNYRGEKDTLLLTLIHLQKTPEAEMSQKRQGPFQVVTSKYELFGNYEDGNLSGKILIKHLQAKVFEEITYTERLIEAKKYTQPDTYELYSGTFTSAKTEEQISVKNGLRNGWCMEYDASGKEIRRAKYKNGVLKKIVESNSSN